MWIADADFHIAPQIKEALIEAVYEEDLGYSDDSEIRQLIQEKVRKINGIEVDADDVYVTQGVLPSMWLACKYACKPGEEVVVTNPLYYPFFTAIEAADARPVYWKLQMEDGYRLDVERLQELISPKTRLIFLCNPHNPTGRAFSKEELSALADIAVDRDLIVMSDELWEDIVYDDRKHICFASLNPEIGERTMTAFGFSKTFCVAGLQIGYVVSANKEMMRELKRIGKGILRGTSSLSLAAAKVMLSDKMTSFIKDVLRHLQRMRDLATELLNEIEGVTCNKVEATYLAFPRISFQGMSSEELKEYLLKEAKVAVEAGSRYGSMGEHHIRVNFGTSEQILREAMNRIKLALSKSSVKN